MGYTVGIHGGFKKKIHAELVTGYCDPGSSTDLKRSKCWYAKIFNNWRSEMMILLF